MAQGVSMNEAKVREILKGWIQPDDSLYCLGHYIEWKRSDEYVKMDDRITGFTADELKAIAWWMEHKDRA